MPVKKFKDPFLNTNAINAATEQVTVATSAHNVNHGSPLIESKNHKGSSTLSLNKKSLKDPKAEPKATPLPTSSNTLTLRERTPNGDLLVEPTTNSSELTKRYNKEDLKLGWQGLSGRMIKYLSEGDRFERLMDETKLRDLGVFLGIATEKVLLLEGQPTQIISQPQHQAIDRLGVALKDALEKRGLVTLTERKISIESGASK